MNHARITSTWALLLWAWLSLPGGAAHADILFNGVSQGSQATIQNGDTIVGSGASAGVTVDGADDQLNVLGGVVDITGAGSIGIRVLDGAATMWNGLVKGVDAGVLVQGGTFEFHGGGIRDGVRVEGAGSVFAMSGGAILNGSFVASSGGAMAISGGTITNSPVAAIGPTSRVDVSGGAISWLDAIDGGSIHVYGTAFTVVNTPVDFAGDDEYIVPSTAGHMSVTYPNQMTRGFKLRPSNGGTVTLHLRTWGDFDGDADVDGADFLRWQRGELGAPLSTPDLNAWEANYGAVSSLSAAAVVVPEPSSWIMVLGSLAAMRRRLPATAA